MYDQSEQVSIYIAQSAEPGLSSPSETYCIFQSGLYFCPRTISAPRPLWKWYFRTFCNPSIFTPHAPFWLFCPFANFFTLLSPLFPISFILIFFFLTCPLLSCPPLNFASKITLADISPHGGRGGRGIFQYINPACRMYVLSNTIRRVIPTRVIARPTRKATLSQVNVQELEGNHGTWQRSTSQKSHPDAVGTILAMVISVE